MDAELKTELNSQRIEFKSQNIHVYSAVEKCNLDFVARQ